mmetsp:Transcript_22939/g.35703  ORF Transcript_22939/g.35703 Transcript_22939/m.35703 type:complete len:307 (-) Transcript_22939:142-1062(-)
MTIMLRMRLPFFFSRIFLFNQNIITRKSYYDLQFSFRSQIDVSVADNNLVCLFHLCQENHPSVSFFPHLSHQSLPRKNRRSKSTFHSSESGGLISSVSLQNSMSSMSQRTQPMQNRLLKSVHLSHHGIDMKGVVISRKAINVGLGGGCFHFTDSIRGTFGGRDSQRVSLSSLFGSESFSSDNKSTIGEFDAHFSFFINKFRGGFNQGTLSFLVNTNKSRLDLQLFSLSGNGANDFNLSLSIQHELGTGQSRHNIGLLHSCTWEPNDIIFSSLEGKDEGVSGESFKISIVFIHISQLITPDTNGVGD